MKDIVLKRFEANSFLGIDSTNPIIIEFPNRKNVIKFSGDMAVGKTSTITAIMYLMGAAFNIEQRNFKNIKDETIDINMDFEYDGDKYNVTASGVTGRIVLKQYIEKTNKYVSLNEPKAVLRKIFGNLGVSPMFLKELSGKKQIQWFKDTFGDDDKINKKEDEIILNINRKYEERRLINKDIKIITGALEANSLYKNYEKNINKFKKPITAEKEKEAFEAAAKKKKDYDRYKEGLDKIKEEHENTKNLIADLEKRLEIAKQEEKELAKRIENGKKWLEDNHNVEDEYKKAEEAWLNMAERMAEYNSWRDVLDKEKELNKLYDKSQSLDAEIDELRKGLLELTQKYLPKIKGLEVKVKTSLTDEEEGIYYDGKTMAQLSESELWALFTQIYEAKGVRFVFCENINSLGSRAVDILNKLVKDGAKVFATEMDRSNKEMTITFETKI